MLLVINPMYLYLYSWFQIVVVMRIINKREFCKLGLAAGCAAISLPGESLFGAASVSKNEDVPLHEGLFYMNTPRGVRCQICPNQCILSEGEVSICHNRIAKGGKIFSMAYGNPCAVHVDPIEKKPLYHFLPESRAYSIATAGCNLACLNCQNWQISQKSPTETRNEKMTPAEVVHNAKASGCMSIAYTYSEPITFFEYTYDTAKLARQEGIRNVLVSAGYINPDPLKYLSGVIDAANIDLKSFDDAIYQKLNAGSLQPVLDTLQILKGEGVWLEITNLIIPEWTDSLPMIRKMCQWLASNGFENVPLHFSRFYPQYKLINLPPTPASILQSAYAIARERGLKYVYIGNLPGADASTTYCPQCGDIMVERRGYRVLQMNVQQGHCPKCGHEIDGAWR